MNKKLIALLAVLGTATIGGVQYYLAGVKPGVTRAELLDAGIDDACDPVEISCQGRDLCQNMRADGGLSPRYRTVKMLAWQCVRPGNPTPVLVTRLPMQSGHDCFEPLGEDACQVVGASFDDGGSPSVAVDVDRCACRERGKICRYQEADGGLTLMQFAQTYPSPFTGAGCVRKSCVEAMGEQGMSMPEECK